MPILPESDSNSQSEKDSHDSDSYTEESTRNKLHAFGITDKDIDEERRRLQEQEKEKELEKKANRKINTYKPTKIIGFNSNQVETRFKDEKGRVIAYIQTRKRKPWTITNKLVRKTKANPDKDTFASVGSFPESCQIYRYKNSEDFFISKGADYVRLTPGELGQLELQLLYRLLSNEELFGMIIASDFNLQYNSKSKLPHLKLKNWVEDGKIVKIDLGDLQNQYKEKLKENREKHDNKSARNSPETP